MCMCGCVGTCIHARVHARRLLVSARGCGGVRARCACVRVRLYDGPPAMTQEPIFVRAVGISFPGPPDPLESDLLVFIVQTTVDLDGARPSIYKRLTWKLERPTWATGHGDAGREKKAVGRPDVSPYFRGTIDSPETNAPRYLYITTVRRYFP